MSELIRWFDSAYNPRGVGGIQGNTDAGNLFLYDDCCVWARANRGLGKLLHSSLDDRVAVGEEQTTLSPETLSVADPHNWRVSRSDIVHGYLWAGEGTVNQGNASFERHVYFNALRLDLADGYAAPA